MAFTKKNEFKKEIISKVEDRIGYVFSDGDTLIQAFTRSSYSKSNNNEILEFFGDTALGLVIVKKMSESYVYQEYDAEWLEEMKKEHPDRSFYNNLMSDYSEGEMTEVKKRLVSTAALSEAITSLGFAKYLVMSDGDVKEGVDCEPHVKEDLFEAIVGAVALDSGWNIDALTSVVDNMLDPDPVIERGYEIAEDYVSEVAAMVETEPIYEVYETERGFEVSVELGCNRELNPLSNLNLQSSADGKKDVGISELDGELAIKAFAFDISNSGGKSGEGDSEKVKVFLSANSGGFKSYGFGKTEVGAKRAAAKKLIEFIKFQKTVLESIDISRPGECVSMLNELSQKDIIPTPSYEIADSGKKSETGNPIWSCTVTVGDDSDNDIGESKSAAKNNAAMRMIYNLLKFNEFMPYLYSPDATVRMREFEKLITKLNKEMKI